jgi:hypothetical protein
MKCDEAKDQLVLLAYGELSEEEQADLELHLHLCAECAEESEAFAVVTSVLAQETLPALSPNLLTASRLRLDEALDEASASTWSMRLRGMLIGTWQHLYAAPALATLLVGVGFLGGNQFRQYETSKLPKPVPPMIITEPGAVVGTVSGIVTTPDPHVVQVKYTQIIPTTYQGGIDEPQVRKLLMMGAQQSGDNAVRAQSVNFLADECKAGHQCEHEGFRDALLVSLRTDKSPAVRLRALEGLQRYVSEDDQVRDAVLQSLLTDSNAEIRTHAIGMLEPVEGDSSVRHALHQVSTQDANPYIRTASMQALGTIDGLQ